MIPLIKLVESISISWPVWKSVYHFSTFKDNKLAGGILAVLGHFNNYYDRLMGILKDKAELSFKTAGFLISEKYYNPSIHCSYYSCIQLMLDVFLEKLKISESMLETQAKTFMQVNRTGHHVFYIQKMRDSLLAKGATVLEINSWHNDLSQLKQKRETSDYSRVPCVPTEAELAKGKAKSVRDLITSKFK